MMWKQGQAVVRVIGGAVVERGEIERVDADGWAYAFGFPWPPSGFRQSPRVVSGGLWDAAEWDAAEAQRKQATRERISETAERVEVRRRLRDALALLPPERLAVLADELEREARGER